jgi:hypothetical protein
VSLAKDLHDHLSKAPTAPFLFVGSGLSRRYIQSETWEGLLTKFADQIGKPYHRYASAAGGDYPAIATALAADFFNHWWDDDRYEFSRLFNPRPAGKSSPLKIEIAQHVESLMANLPTVGPEYEELEVLKQARIQGVITTNYDKLLETVFPDFSVFTGQEELLFTDPVGVGEIYKIHGGCDQPESLVLTTEDYAGFDRRNPYLAAKLLTMFVEHPVIFLGYSLTDPNVRDILTSIATILSKENLHKLADRLIFVQWAEHVSDPRLTQTVFPFDRVTIPIWEVTVSDFTEVFSALAGLKERIPVAFLRRFKEQITELVRTSDPKNKTYVMDLEDVVNISDLELVVGVGLHKQLELQPQGIVGLSRYDLLSDVLDHHLDTDQTDAMKLLVSKVLPKYVSGRTNTPIYRYLRACGYLSDDGTIRDGSVPSAMQERVRQGRDFFKPGAGYFLRRAEEIADSVNNFAEFVKKATVFDMALALSVIDTSKIDLEALRDRLSVELSKTARVETSLAKSICIYDCLISRTL